MNIVRHLFLLIVFAGIAPLLLAQEDTVARIKSMDEIVVTGTRSAAERQQLPQTVTIIDRGTLTLQERPNVLPTLMEQVPGLMVTSRGMMGYGVSTGAAGGIALRGLSSSNGQMLVLIDGQPQYNGLFSHSIADSYQTLMADRIEVVRGPASMLYGSNAMGGVINIITRQMQHDGTRMSGNFGMGSYGTVQEELSLQMRKGRWSATIGQQYGQSDNHRPNMGFNQYGGFAKVGYHFSDHWDASADLDLTHFNASNPGTTVEPKIDNDQKITRGAAALTMTNRYAWGNGRISIYDNFGRHKIDDGYTEGKAPQSDFFNSRDRVAGLAAYQTLTLWQGGHATVGFDYQDIYGHAWYTDKQTDTTVTAGRRVMQSTDQRAHETAGYIDLRQDLWQWLTLEGGLRYDYHTVAGGEWVPQAGIVMRPISGGELRLTAGKGFRNPTMKEMYLYGTANHDSLHAERMWNYEVAWQQRLFDGRLRYSVNLFAMKGDNMIQTVAGKNINSGSFNNQGVELDAAWQAGEHWHIATNHSYLHMEQPIVAAPQYKGYLGLHWHCGHWSATAGLQYIGGLYTEVGDNETTENFAILNAMIAYEAAQGVRLWIKGDNLLNTEYEINAGYPMPRATAMIGISIAQ